MTTYDPEQNDEHDGWLVYPCPAADELAEDSASDDHTRRLDRKARAKLRMLVWHRDPPVCVWCHAPLHRHGRGSSGRSDYPFTIDHIVPRSMGGSDHPDNLVLACRACNSRRGQSGPVTFLAERQKAALKQRRKRKPKRSR